MPGKPERFDLVVLHGQCVTPGGVVAADVGVRDGRIAALGSLLPATAAETFDARGLHVLAGVIDSHVHLREPGAEHKEDIATGTAAAALGGVTAVFDMPNNAPPTTTAEALADKARRARGRAWVDHAFFVGADATADCDLAALERLPGCAGVKLFVGSSTGGLLVEGDAAIRRVLASGRRRVAVHAEDEARLRERRDLALAGAPATHPVWRDEETALRATRRVLALARETGRPVHLLHLSTAAEAALLAKHRDLATVEVTPQHLSLVAPDCYEVLGTRAQMNPPIRDRAHQDALWEAVRGGLADTLASDHAPHTREEKARPYPSSPSGLPGVQTLVPLMLDHVARGRLSLERFAELASAGPARVFGVAGKGRLAVGWDADLTLVDLACRREITGGSVASRCGWTPFHGRVCTGWPVATVVRGRVVARDGALVGSPVGQPVRFAGVVEGEGAPVST